MTIEAKAQVTTAIQGASEGESVYLRALRDGTMVKADWKQAAVFGGHGFMCQSGNFITGLAGGGSASEMDLDRPNLCISIPNGTAFIPLRFDVNANTGTPADGGEVEILIAVDQDKAIKTDGTGTATTVYNMNTLCGRSTACTVRNTFSTTMSTDPVLDLELARKVVEFEVLSTLDEAAILVDLVYEPKTPPVINGPAAVLVYVGGDAAIVSDSVYINAKWLEFTETPFNI